MFTADIFESKIINDEAKSDRTCYMLPEAGRTLDGMVSKICQMLDESVVC